MLERLDVFDPVDHATSDLEVLGAFSDPAPPLESSRADLPTGRQFGLIEEGFSRLRLLSRDPRGRRGTKAS